MKRVRIPVDGGRAALFTLMLCAAAAFPAIGQEKTDTLSAGRDSVRIEARDTAASPRNTLQAAHDTVKAESPSGVDTVVTYVATDSIIYALSNKTMYLYGNGNITYRDLRLKAERIAVNWNTSVLNAVGVPDTADTTGRKFRGQPDLTDAGETYHGSTVAYNFKTKKGRIDLGKTEIERGYYYGDEIKKVQPDVLFVEDGRFTTCDLEHPHYYFASPEMKVMVKDKIIARPVYFYVDDVPVFALPFGIFPSQRGRRSGVIGPAYGESSRGRYLTHLGYYWAMNDYMDWNIRGDGYTKGSYTLYSDFRYGLRYFFNGSMSGSYARVITGERGDPSYSDQKVFNLHFDHSQAFNPTTQLRVDFTFTSGSYYQNTSYNLDDLLRQNIVSNATLTKSWEGTPNSMTMNIHRDQNLQTGQVSEVLPSISFNRAQTFPFRFGKSSGSSGSLAWYELIGYTYSGQFANDRNKTPLGVNQGFTFDQRDGVQHNIALNASPRLGYFSVTPFFNYSEKWYDRYTDKHYDFTDSALISTEPRAVKAVRYWSTGISAATKFYGLVQPGILGITGIRHQVTPSLTYTYQPDFSKPRYGYFGTYVDTNGAHIYNRYEGGIFGGAPAGEQQAVSLNVGNVFEMKTRTSDTAETENKYQLLNLGLGISYNFAADSLRFSELTASYRTSIGQLFTVGGSSSFNLYKFDPVTQRRVNRFLLNEQGRLAQLTNFSISVGTRLSGEKKKTTAGPVRTEGDSLARLQKGGYVGLYDQETPDFSIPWNLDLTWNFNQNQSNPAFKFRSSTLAASLGFNLTEYWKITASANYDIINKSFAAPQITVYRDLHCWEMNFSWVPTGQYRNFRLEIRLKDPQLQDVKVTKQSSARGIY